MTAELSPQLRKGVVEYCVLGLISTRPMYGWELADQLQTAGLISSIGTLYPVLSRLRERGDITMTELQQGAGPARKYYVPTKSGEKRLETFRADWSQLVHQISLILGEE